MLIGGKTMSGYECFKNNKLEELEKGIFALEKSTYWQKGSFCYYISKETNGFYELRKGEILSIIEDEQTNPFKKDIMFIIQDILDPDKKVVLDKNKYPIYPTDLCAEAKLYVKLLNQRKEIEKLNKTIEKLRETWGIR